MVAVATLLSLTADSGFAQQAPPTQPPAAAKPAPPAAAKPPAVQQPVAKQAPGKKISPDSAAAAAEIADFFNKVGDRIYEDCIFDLSQEQLEVQHALIEAYVKQGATNAQARKLAVKQIRPPKLSPRCEQIRTLPKSALPSPGPLAAPVPPQVAKKPPAAGETLPWSPGPKKEPAAVADVTVGGEPAKPLASLASKKLLAHWDCAPGVDFVTIKHKGYERKLTGGEICNPFQDVYREVPASVPSFKFGYTIKTGRLFLISDDAQLRGKTISWAISGRDVCRNDPDPECLSARAVGPLPPGEYSFSNDKENRVSWGPKTKRTVAGIYLNKLWNQERFTPQQAKAILARGNIAFHARYKGEMSEACLGLEPKSWTYVASLIKDGRATGLNVYIDEPYPQLAEAPPVIAASSFSLTSLFK